MLQTDQHTNTQTPVFIKIFSIFAANQNYLSAMKKHMTRAALAAFVFLQIQLQAQITDPKLTEVWEPQPRIVTPGTGTQPPSDAIVLFDGKSMDGWVHKDGSSVKWEVKDGAVTVVGGTGDIFTRRVFGDCQLHIEWRTPGEVKGEGQGRGNSGVFLQSRYEVQVLDNYGNKTYANGQAGSTYKQAIPLVNACRPPGEWQTYDILYTAPRFNSDGIRLAPGYVTVMHNGIVVQNHTEIKGTTVYIGMPQNDPHGEAALQLQDHGDRVSYRNIWIRQL
jgi:hypothetical protein